MPTGSSGVEKMLEAGAPPVSVAVQLRGLREHAVPFQSMLRRKGIRVVSITERADDLPTSKLMARIIARAHLRRQGVPVLACARAASEGRGRGVGAH